MDLTPSSAAGRALATQQIDIGAAFEFARRDPDWLTKYALHGLVLFIPVVGSLAYFGWGRRVYQQIQQGQEDALPELDLGGEIADGIPPFVTALNMVAVILPLVFLMQGLAIGGMVLGGVASAAFGDIGELLMGLVMLVLTLVFYALFFVTIIAANLIMPELQRRGYNGEMGPLFSIGRSLRIIRAHPSQYLMTFVGVLVANLVGSVGMVLCGVGAILTLSMGHAMAAHVLAQWNAIAEGTPPDA